MPSRKGYITRAVKRKQPLIAVVVVLGVLGAGAGLAAALFSPSTAATSPARTKQSFYQDVKASLAPLLIHIRHIPEVLHAHAAPTAPAPPLSMRDTGRSWADDVATARDLVARLSPPSDDAGALTLELYELAVLFYGESARVVEDLTVVSPQGGVETAEFARSGLRLRLLGDRIFDQAKRVLGDPSGPEARRGRPQVAQSTLPDPVPDFAAEGIEPIGNVTSGSEGAKTRRTDRWLAQIRDLLGATAHSFRADAVPPPSGTVAALETLARSAPSPSTEGIVAARLSALSHAEALRRLKEAKTVSPSTSPALERARRLRLISERLWSVAESLLRREGTGTADPLPSSGIDRSLLYHGGAFDGHPPLLRPGDDPGTGLPGGLPIVDPSTILGG